MTARGRPFRLRKDPRSICIAGGYATLAVQFHRAKRRHAAVRGPPAVGAVVAATAPESAADVKQGALCTAVAVRAHCRLRPTKIRCVMPFMEVSQIGRNGARKYGFATMRATAAPIRLDRAVPVPLLCSPRHGWKLRQVASPHTVGAA